MDNQQRTSIFAGILEGEGSFGLAGLKNPIRVRISNTDYELIAFCMAFLEKNGISYRTSNWRRDIRLREYEISVDQHSLKKLYDLVKLECRNDEFANILGLSETTRESSVDLWWAVGIIEAEGSFDLVRRISKANKINYQPVLHVCSTTDRIIEKFVKTMNFEHVGIHVHQSIPQNQKHNPYKTAAIRGWLRIANLLTHLKEEMFVSSKYKEKVRLIKEACTLRLYQIRSDNYLARHHEIYYRLRNMI